MTGVNLQLRNTPTITAGLYAPNRQIGSPVRVNFTSSTHHDRTLNLRNFAVLDKSNFGPKIRLNFFSENPTTLVSTNNTLFNMSATQFTQIWLNYFDIAQTDYTTETIGGTPIKIASFHEIGLSLYSTQIDELQRRVDTIYVLPICEDTPTFLTTSDLTFIYNFED